MDAKDLLAHLDKRFDRVDDRLERQDVRLDEVNTTLVRQGDVLDEHIRRTEAAEAGIATLKAELVPLKTHVAMWSGAGKLVAVASVVVGLVIGLLKLLGV